MQSETGGIMENLRSTCSHVKVCKNNVKFDSLIHAGRFQSCYLAVQLTIIFTSLAVPPTTGEKIDVL